MSSQAPKIDFVSKLVFLVSSVALLAVVYILLSSLMSTYKRNSIQGEINTSPYLVKSVSSNLQLVGQSVTSDAPAASASATRSGKEIYTAVCAACHDTGAAGAPKVGDKAAWEPKIATGLDALMKTAINGKGAMPARGGQNVSDEELKVVIRYMAKEMGFDLGSDEPATKEKKAETEAKTTPKDDAAQETKKKETTSKTEEPQAPAQPNTPATPNTPAAPVLATETEAATDSKKVTGTTHEVKMLNSGKDGIMVFEPASLKVAVGDTVKFIPTDSGHNAASTFTPEGAITWKGAIGQAVSVTIDKEGFYFYVCDPHETLGMMGVILAGNPVNQDAAVSAAKELSSSLAMGKDRLEKYMNALK